MTIDLIDKTATKTLKIAGLNDIPAILEMAKKLYEGSPYAALALDLVQAREQLEKFIIKGGQDYLVVLSHDEGKPVGVVAAYAFRPMFSSEKVAVESLLWLEPEYRNGRRGKELIEAYEYWAKLVGVSIVQYGLLSSADPRMEAFYKRIGATEAERIFYKDIR